MKIEAKGENVIISDFDENAVLRIAIKIEKDGIAAYKDAGKKVVDEKMKKTLKRIEEDEEDHLRIFTSLYENMLKDQGLDPADIDVEEGIFDYMDSGIFDGVKELKGAAAVGDIIRKGIDVEAKTLMFYAELYKGIKSEQSKLRVKSIIDQEKMHYNIMKSWENVFK